MTPSTAAPPIADVPPHDADTEAAVLGAILVSAADSTFDAESAVEMLHPRDFYVAQHRHVFEAIQTVVIHHERPDAVAVLAELRAAKALDAAGGEDRVRELATCVESAANVDANAARVRGLAVRRSVLIANAEIRAAALSGRGTADELLEHAEARLFALRRSSASMRPVPAQDVATKLVDRWSGVTEPEPSVSTGLASLDDMILGLHKGSLVTVAGATSMGKTTMALNLIRYAALSRIPSLLISLEMSRDEVVTNLLCADCGVDTRRAQKPGLLTDSDAAALSASYARRWLAPVRVLDSPTMTAGQIRSAARRDVASRGTSLVVVDYVQLVAPGHDESHAPTREQQVAAISRSMKALARELSVPVVVLAQLNRDADKRPANERHPRLSDLRESAAIAHDSDVVIGMYRASYYEPTNRLLANQIEACVLKNRHGPTGRVSLAYSPSSAFIGDARLS